MATLVKFLKDTEDGEIVAVFPQYKYNKHLFGDDRLSGYVHMGQHTGISKGYIKERTIKANESEYKDLRQELESIGYNLKICK